MGKLIDLTNQQFGELLVLQKATKEEILQNTTASITDTRAYWWVQCSCGAKPFVVLGKSLREGKTKSCGHLRKTIGQQKIKDLSGQKFGNLEVLNFCKIEDHRAVWHCRCICGREKDIKSDLLLSGHAKSCGCRPNRENYSHPIDIANQHFGFLVPLYITDKRTNDGHAIWHCQCLACNNEIDISSHTILSGHAKSCGCVRSKGETKITKILQENNIKFEKQKTFDNCINISKLRFDFYVNNTYIIEYDGEQHFSISNSGWNTKETFQKTQLRDNIKNQWCKENNIPLIRIPYTHYNDLCLEDLLLETSNFIVK